MLDPVFNVTVENEKSDYATLVIEPLKQGYGHTLGNALRRILLNSLSGAAITSVKIKGVKHQFTTLEGMGEDIVQFILNLKTVRVSLEEGKEKETLTLEATGTGDVTAGDIVTPPGVTISNPDVHLASLADSKSTLKAEITVERGTGYSPADERKSTTIGLIPVDALFSPIKRVNPTVAATRVGRRTDFDKLTLEVWTDGTIAPKTALEEAAKILVEHFQQIIDPVASPEEAEADAPSYESNETLRLTVEELDLPTRIANALRKGGFKTVGDLTAASKDEVAKVKNLGERSVVLVEEALEEKGVSFS